MSKGGVEHWNEEAGAVWINRIFEKFPPVAWLNPGPEVYWSRVYSVKITHELVQQRMYGLAVDGIGKAIDGLKRKH